MHNGDDSRTYDYAVLLDSCDLSVEETRVQTYNYQLHHSQENNAALFEAFFIEHYWKEAVKRPPLRTRNKFNCTKDVHSNDGVLWYTHLHISPEEMRLESYLQVSAGSSL